MELTDKLRELAGDKLSEEERKYMLYFADMCDKAGLEYGKDRQNAMSRYVPEYDDKGELVGAHSELVTDPEFLPTMGGQIFSSRAAAKIGKYIADKFGVEVE